MDNRYSVIYSQIDLIRILMPMGDEKRISEEFDKLFELEKSTFGGEYRSPEDVVVMFDLYKIMAENHIRLGNMLELTVYGVQWADIFRDFMENAPFSEAEKRPVKEAYFRLHNLLRNYMSRVSRGKEEVNAEIERHNMPNVRPQGCRCMLCRKNVADKTGSHMVPEFLLEKVFNYQSRKGRGYEAVERFTLDASERYEYFGPGVSPEEREEEINRPLLEDEKEEAQRRHNPFMFDYFFCSECEKRLSVIESWYADISRGRGGEYPPMIPLLFWMSVVWRMSISNMSVCLTPAHKEKYRRALDRALALSRDGILVKPSAGAYTAYSLHRVTDLKGETPSLIGAPVSTVPTTVILGDTILDFFHSKDKATRMADKGFNAAMLNTGTAPEQIGQCDFIGFWLTKRRLLDLNWEYNGPESPYEPNGVSQFIAKRNFEEEHLRATGEMAHFDSAPISRQPNEYALVVPYSIQRIRQFMEAHPEGTTPEELEAALGYTPDEVSIMMDHWVNNMNSELIESDDEEV